MTNERSKLVNEINGLIVSRSLLKHPFYVAWSEGCLAKSSLEGYAKEYFELVKAVPVFVGKLLRKSPPRLQSSIREHQVEEASHIPLWANFAEALGVDVRETASKGTLPKTKEAIDALLSTAEEFETGASAMYAFEKEIPSISKTKVEGLKKYYGIEDERAVEYFVEHQEADIRHAKGWEEVLHQTETPEKELLNASNTSMDAQHLVLDACYEAYC